ncbi:MAG: hypothetical protein PWR23_1550 [Peptostreptococcaceae bacterium]|jgi:ArsR family transcriptional regulator|nr:hypothetical protein [Peptostreptococcaceae bacterium]
MLLYISIDIDMKERNKLDYESNARLFKAFCDENRLRIIDLLKDGEKCACTLQDELTIVQSTLSHHMKILIESKVVEARKDKKWTYYSLSDSGSELAKNTLSDILTKSENYSSFCICED